jgi:hypothetical protein
MPVIPELRRLRQGDRQVGGQPRLHSETVSPKKKINKQKNNINVTTSCK